MNKLITNLKLLIKIYIQSFKITPISSIVICVYIIFQSIVPALIITLNTRLFNSVEIYVNTSKEFSTIINTCILILLIIVIQRIFDIVVNILINTNIYEKCISMYKIKITESSSELRLIDYENTSIKDKMTRAYDCVQLEKLSQLYMSMLYLVTNIVNIISVMIILSRYSMILVLICLASVIPYFLIRLIRGKEFYYMKYKQVPMKRRLDYLWGLLSNRDSAKEMRVMGFGNHITSEWIKCRDKVNKEVWHQNKKDMVSLIICDCIKIIGYGISLQLTLLLVLQKSITIGVFSSCIYAFMDVQESTKSFLVNLAFFPEMLLYANDYFTYINLPKEYKGAEKFDGLQNSIKIENVKFSYPNVNINSLDGVDLEIKKGDTIVILGQNGSGKTTLSKLLMGIYTVKEGSISYDNKDINCLKRDDLNKYLSTVSQKFVKYQTSLRENVAISDLNNLYDDRKIIDILSNVKLSYIVEDVDLDIAMGSTFGGKELSGGEWQKLSIARGYFKNSEIIFLDEPTSALDPIVEKEILNNFIELSRGKTAIIISHRVGLCKLANKIVVMKNGKIEEIGSHDELIGRNGEYTNLYKTQEYWYKEKIEEW